MDMETWANVGKIIDSKIDNETFQSILIDHLGDGVGFRGKRKEQIILDAKWQETFGFTTNNCVFVKQPIGKKQPDGSYSNGLPTVILTGADQITQNGYAKTNKKGRVGLGATNVIYFSTYNHEEKDYVKAIKEVINYLGLDEIELINLLKQHGIEAENLEEIASELDIIAETEVSENIVMENKSLEFEKADDKECISLLEKMQRLIEPNLFVYQLYQNSFIEFDEYIRVQELLISNNNEINELNLTLAPSAILALDIADTSVSFKKDSGKGYIISQNLEFEDKEKQDIDYATLCELSKIGEPNKYGITQILMNSNLSPNEILIECASDSSSSSSSNITSENALENSNSLSVDERKIFENAISFCKAQNPFFIGKSIAMKNMVKNTVENLQNEIVKDRSSYNDKMLKSAIHKLNSNPLYVYDTRFFESKAQNNQKDILEKKRQDFRRNRAFLSVNARIKRDAQDKIKSFKDQISNVVRLLKEQSQKVHFKGALARANAVVSKIKEKVDENIGYKM